MPLDPTRQSPAHENTGYKLLTSYVDYGTSTETAFTMIPWFQQTAPWNKKRPVVVSEGWQTEALEHGDVISVTDRTFEWGPDYLKNSELEPYVLLHYITDTGIKLVFRWRLLCDTTADQALAHLPELSSWSSGISESPFETLRYHIKDAPIEEQIPNIQAFWSEVCSLPSFCTASTLPGQDEFGKPSSNFSGGWKEAQTLLIEGQQVYVKYAGPIGLALLVC
jgi:hypothetical protein